MIVRIAPAFAALALCLAPAATACAQEVDPEGSPGAGEASDVKPPADLWWDSVSALCGHAYEGRLVRAPEGDTTFEGQRLVMHVRTCDGDRLQIPFVAGDNLSRTWVLTRLEDGRVELRHDHRHEDGTPEDVTMYGGVSPSSGGEAGQIFPADNRTLETLPNAWPNVWMMEIVPGERFVYFVQRLGTERAFRVEFDLTRTVEAPPEPWGWADPMTAPVMETED